MENKTLDLMEDIEELQKKANKWDIISNSSAFDCLMNIHEKLDTALVECSCLQQLVINSIEESDDNTTDLPHIRYATQRLMDITNAIYYEKKAFSKLFE